MFDHRCLEAYVVWEKPFIKSIGRYYQRVEGLERREALLRAIERHGARLHELYQKVFEVRNDER